VADSRDLASDIESRVTDVLRLPDDEREIALEDIALDLFAEQYDAVADDDSPDLDETQLRAYTASMAEAIDQTREESSVELVSRWLAQAATNAAVMAATPPGVPLTWFTMEDDRVRDLHVPMHGATVAAGEPFDVGGFPLFYPGQPVGPPEVWINCRCGLHVGGVTAASASSTSPSSGIAVVILPSNPEALIAAGLPPDELHTTLGYFGKTDDAEEGLRERLSGWVQDGHLGAPITAKVTGQAELGPDKALVAMLEHPAFNVLRDSLEHEAPPDPEHPHFTPQMTMAYGEKPEAMPDEVEFDKLGLWWGDEREQTEPVPPVTETSRAVVGKEAVTDDEADEEGPPASSTTSSLVAAPANTHDGPGWLTHPRDTQRLRNYWTRGAGAAKIGWGSPNDLTRCEKHLRKYVGPMWAWGTCNNLHHVVFGIFNPESRGGRRASAEEDIMESQNDSLIARAFDTKQRKQMADRKTAMPDGSFPIANVEDLKNAIQAIGRAKDPEAAKRHIRKRARALGAENLIPDSWTAAVEPEEDDPMTTTPQPLPPPAEWFDDPHLPGPTPLTITSDGRVVGHLASWDTCHVGITGECITPPHSPTQYAYFRTGERETADGGVVATGAITMNTGHAAREADPRSTIAHYDDTGTGVADVAAGEDDHGIWIAGAMRPTATEQDMFTLKATGALSGDWRRIGGNLELVAALAVNVPGFPIPRLELAASANGVPTALVAAAIVERDPNADPDRIAIAVIARLDQREIDRAAARSRAERAAALIATTHDLRVAALTAAVR
jgi:hypothetical protein